MLSDNYFVPMSYCIVRCRVRYPYSAMICIVGLCGIVPPVPPVNVSMYSQELGSIWIQRIASRECNGRSISARGRKACVHLTLLGAPPRAPPG